MKLLMILLAGMALTACLKTRAELAGSDNNGTAVETTREPGRYVAGTLNQQQRAQIDSRFYEIDRDFRQLYGKIEVLENKLIDAKAGGGGQSMDSASAKKVADLEKRVATLEEAILALDKKVSGKGKTSLRSDNKKPKGPYALGEYYFARKEYENAVQAYEEYRRKSPKGERYSAATFKMGECFRKLNMKQDARAFYQEVVERFPKTAVAKSAKDRLKSIQ